MGEIRSLVLVGQKTDRKRGGKLMQGVGFLAHRRDKDGMSQSLWDHLEETALLSGKFAAKVGLEKCGELLGLLHDLGKASDEFNYYIQSATGLIDPDDDDYVDASEKKGKIDHSSAGAQLIFRSLSRQGKESMWAAQILSLVLASHHSGIFDCITPEGNDKFTQRMSKSDDKTHFAEAVDNMKDSIKRKVESLLHDNHMLIVFNQKLKSIHEREDSPETWMLKLGLLTRFLFSCLIDADRLNTADFEFPQRAKLRNQGDYIKWPVLIERLDRYLLKFQNYQNPKSFVNSIREEISKQCFDFSTRPQGIFQLTVPTGGGKTLSSLRFALNHAKEHQLEKIIYIIPYTSIIDQNADVVRKILVKNDNVIDDWNQVVLEHHSNLTPDEENTRQKLLAENWDAPIVFTTMVQFLETLFGHGTRNARRMHQLAKAVLIFDEIQTLPVKCVHLFNIAVRFLRTFCNSTIVLCTATQPLLDKVEPVQRALCIKDEQKIIPDTLRLFQALKRVEVFDRRKKEGWYDEEVVNLALKELTKTGSVLIIVNTKQAARDLYRLLKDCFQGVLYHLSTNMCPMHRMYVLNRIKECLPDIKPVICVSTQLIEAGVDIDFGSVIRYQAGLDSIAQAAGRCNRNGARLNLGRVTIINPRMENLSKLKDVKIGKEKTERILDEFQLNPEEFDGDIIGLKAMERYYKYYFYERSGDMNYPVNSNSTVGRSDNLFNLLSTNQYSVIEFQRINQLSPSILLRQSFMTAAKAFEPIDSLTRGVIVPYGEEGKEIINELCAANNLEKQISLIKRAQRYSVNVFSNQFNQFVQQKIIQEIQNDAGIFYLDERHYSGDYGMSEEPVDMMPILSF